MARKDIQEHNIKRLEVLSTFIHELRISSGLTQVELHEETGLHRNTIIRSEKSCQLTLLSIFEIADALHVSPGELISICE